MSRNLATRIVVAAVAIPIILWICYQGGWWLLGMVAFFALAAMAEFLLNEGYTPGSSLFWVAMLAVILILVAIGYGLDESMEGSVTTYGSILLPVIVGTFVLSAMFNAIGKQPPDVLFVRSARFFWGVSYVVLLYPVVFLLGEVSRVIGSVPFSGGDCLLFLFGVLWVGDTAAMGVGKWLGKRRLAPTVSPGKTVAGFVGGLLGALAVALLMVFWKFKLMPWYHVLAIAMGASVFGQLGDLVESMWKRSLGIKDSSSIIPGHGGVLDRFDSLLFAAPFMLAYLVFLTP
jgi:phosphatidate cytidylyltransferase